ncbi:MAG: hypothetical protein ACRDH9_09500 [Actinomycetota bacterium]
MGHPDDYRDEMERLTSQEADNVLSGVPTSAAAARGAVEALERLRGELLVVPEPEVAQRHIAAMRAAARSDSLHEGGIPMRRRNRKRLASLALAATLVLGAGIAAALTLPDQASDEAKERVADVQPPSQGPSNDGSSNADEASAHGKAVSAVARDDSTKGCEHGRAVSEAASSKAADNRQNDGDHLGACGPNEKNKGNHSDGNNGNHGLGNNGNHGEKNDAGQGQSSGAGSETSNAGGKGNNLLPHGKDTAPGQVKDQTSEPPTGA